MLRFSIPTTLALGAVASLAAANVAIAAPVMTTTATTIGEILDAPAAKAVVDKHLPGVLADPKIKMARPLTLKGLQRFAKDKVSDSALSAIDKDFAGLAKN